MTRSASTYRITDQLFLWWVLQPDVPVLIGDLDLVRTSRGGSLCYSDTWRERGFALSEDLPLVPGAFLPAEKDTAAGAVDDARPDRWGERVIRVLDKPGLLMVGTRYDATRVP